MEVRIRYLEVGTEACQAEVRPSLEMYWSRSLVVASTRSRGKGKAIHYPSNTNGLVPFLFAVKKNGVWILFDSRYVCFGFPLGNLFFFAIWSQLWNSGLVLNPSTATWVWFVGNVFFNTMWSSFGGFQMKWWRILMYMRWWHFPPKTNGSVGDTWDDLEVFWFVKYYQFTPRYIRYCTDS